MCSTLPLPPQTRTPLRYLHFAAAPMENVFAGAIVPAAVDLAAPQAIRSSGQQFNDHPHNLVPLTVKQVSMLVPCVQHGGLLSIHGIPVSTARLLGRMLNRRDMTEEISFVLADGTGAIEAKIWTIDSEYMQAVRSVRDGDYVIVNGSIKRQGHVMHIRVYSLSVVSNYNAITHHFLQCVYVHLDLQKKYKDRQEDLRRRDLALAVHEQSYSVPSSSNRLFDDVLRVFYHPGILELENGASFSLIQSQTGADAAQLRSVIGAHVAMGNLFTTIDDDHFKCSFNG